MTNLFLPATALMNRLRYPYKFATLGLPAFGAIAFLLFALVANFQTTIEANRKELSGAEMARTLLPLVQTLQLHRGLSAGALGSGDEAVKSRRMEKEIQVDAALKRVDAVDARLGEMLKTRDDWKTITGKWENLRANGLGMSVANNVAAHSALIAEALTLLRSVVENSGLILDPAFDTYYLMDSASIQLPELLERMGQLRAQGMTALSTRQTSEAQQATYHRRAGALRKVLSDLQSDLKRSAGYNPALATQLGKASQELSVGTERLLKLTGNAVVDGRFEMPPQLYFDQATEEIDLGYRQMFETLFPTLEQLLQQRIEKDESRLHLNIGMAMIVVMGIVYLAIGLYLAIVAGIRSLTEGAERVAAGDLASHIEFAAHDELRVAADHFNSMIEAVRCLIGSIQAEAHNVSAAAGVLAASSDQMSHASEQQSSAASSMAAAVEQMTVGVEAISRHAESAQSISRDAGQLSAEGNEIVQTTAGEMSSIAETVNTSARIIEELGEHSEKINAIVHVIEDVAKQTNLLALNAAIEAARAGEAGRGFSVVADEVRKLAERTGAATHEIAGMIAAIQQGTSDAVRSMQDGVDRVKKGVALAQQAGNSISQISHGASQVVQTIGDISLALREQSAASAEIGRNVEKVAQMSEENHASLAETAATARELERLAGVLQSQTKRFQTA